MSLNKLINMIMINLFFFLCRFTNSLTVNSRIKSYILQDHAVINSIRGKELDVVGNLCLGAAAVMMWSRRPRFNVVWP